MRLQNLNWFKSYAPKLVGEGVVYLCSRNCTTSGEMYRIGGGMFSRYAISGNIGLRDGDISAEKIAAVLVDTVADMQRTF